MKKILIAIVVVILVLVVWNAVRGDMPFIPWRRVPQTFDNSARLNGGPIYYPMAQSQVDSLFTVGSK